MKHSFCLLLTATTQYCFCEALYIPPESKKQSDFKAEIKDCSETSYFFKKGAKLGAIHPCFCLLTVGDRN